MLGAVEALFWGLWGGALAASIFASSAAQRSAAHGKSTSYAPCPAAELPLHRSLCAGVPRPPDVAAALHAQPRVGAAGAENGLAHRNEELLFILSEVTKSALSGSASPPTSPLAATPAPPSPSPTQTRSRSSAASSASRTVPGPSCLSRA